MLAPLRRCETRYFVDKGDDNKEYPEDCPEERKRACIWDSHKKKGRFEIQQPTLRRGVALRRSLHISADKCSVGMPFILFTYLDLPTRGVPVFDYFHEDWNGLKRTFAEAGVMTVVKERIIAENLRHGPWEGHTHFRTLSQYAKELVDNSDSSEPIFQMLYERMCQEAHDQPPNFGSEEHAKTVFESIPAAPSLHKLGKKYVSAGGTVSSARSPRAGTAWRNCCTACSDGV